MTLDSIVDGKKSVAISGHIRPDGDCVGSCLGVYNYLFKNYPQLDFHVFLFFIPNLFCFMKHSDAIEQAKDEDKVFDLFICLDCGDLDRLGMASSYFKNAKTTLCIDHHLSNQAFAEYNIIVPDSSSTCELVYQAMNEDKITKEVAECLYTGILHDTGQFQYDCTSMTTMEIAGKLMNFGIAYSDIVDKTMHTSTFEQVKVSAHAMLKAKRFYHQQIIASYITKEEMKEFSVEAKHLNGIVAQLRNVKDVSVAIFLYELEDEYKVSTRSSVDIDLSKLAMKYHGGGHAKAAGFSMQGNADEIIAVITADIISLLEELN